MWAYRTGKGSHEPIVLLDYQPGRGQIHPKAFLGDYRGIVMSDGYTAWRTLEGATHIGCMAHSRRRFVDALKARKKGGGPPEQALRFFEQLYRVERQARDEKPDSGETPDQCIRRFRRQHCQSAFKFDPVSASNFDPFERRVLAVALASSELVGVAETVRARAA